MTYGYFGLLLFGFAFQLTQSARILGVVPSPSYSHQVAFQPLWKELSLRGHQLVVITTQPMNSPLLTNLTEIDISSVHEIWRDGLQEIINAGKANFPKVLRRNVKLFNDVMETELKTPQVRALIKNETEHFDLVMAEFLFPATAAFATRFRCPLIGFTSLEAPIVTHRILGNPTHPVLYPDIFLPFAGQLNFGEKVVSTLYSVFMKIFIETYALPITEEMIKRHFGSDYPPLREMTNNVSMLFTNTNPIFNVVRPLVPAVIEIGGGTHFKPAQSLPKDLQKVLDEAEPGAIYFSLGTNVKSISFSNSTLESIGETFAELPYTVLWKFDGERFPGALPNNVVVSKWFPQQDILRHPNIKLFITQGGLQSLEEAIYNYVPILGMPFFADQPANIKRMVAKGVGLSMDHTKLDKQSFKATILELIENPRYKKTMKELVELVQDQPMSGLEKAIWWTEYVIRHKGAKHLKCPAADMSYTEYLLLDVIGFCLAVLLLIAYLLYKTIKITLKFAFFLMRRKVKKE